jgi:hypothetical protein
MQRMSQPTPEKTRRRSAPLIWIGGLLAAVLLVLGVSGTLSTWTAAILTNDSNQAGTTAAVVLEETGPDAAGATVTCTTAGTTTNTATCSQINKYGDAGALVTTLQPGDSISTAVQLTNTGSGDATSFTMTPGACGSVYNTGSQSGSTPAGADDLCTQLQVSVTCTGGATLSTGPVSLAAFQASGPYTLGTGLASGATATCTFTVSLPGTTPANFSGQTATQSIQWQLSA